MPLSHQKKKKTSQQELLNVLKYSVNVQILDFDASL